MATPKTSNGSASPHGQSCRHTVPLTTCRRRISKSTSRNSRHSSSRQVPWLWADKSRTVQRDRVHKCPFGRSDGGCPGGEVCDFVPAPLPLNIHATNSSTRYVFFSPNRYNR